MIRQILRSGLISRECLESLDRADHLQKVNSGHLFAFKTSTGQKPQNRASGEQKRVRTANPLQKSGIGFFDVVQRSKQHMILMIVAAAIAIGALIFVISTRGGSPFMFSTPWARRKLRNDIETILTNYSNSLSTGYITQEDYYTPMMRKLIQERRSFYEEYFESRFSTLDGINSEFLLGFDYSGIEISALPNSQMSVKVVEEVTLYGRYSVSNLSEDNFEIILQPRHYLVVAESKGGFQILEDTFTDWNSIDNPGTDNVVWKDGQFYRTPRPMMTNTNLLPQPLSPSISGPP